MRTDKLTAQTMEKLQGQEVTVEYSVGAKAESVSGTIVGYDNYTILVEDDTESHLLFKTCISRIGWVGNGA